MVHQIHSRTYGSSETFLADAQICERNWLHRHSLTFDVDGEVCEVSCELPPDLRRSLAMLVKKGMVEKWPREKKHQKSWLHEG